jgi:Lactate dehydrogenase and related dehydrogenases
MKIVFLDAATLGSDADFKEIEQYGSLILYPSTGRDDVIERVGDAEVLIVNKVVIGKEEIDRFPALRLICVAATGVNNIDVKYAAERGIEVKNAVGYSTESVVQITFGSLLSLINNSIYFDNV